MLTNNQIAINAYLDAGIKELIIQHRNHPDITQQDPDIY